MILSIPIDVFVTCVQIDHFCDYQCDNLLWHMEKKTCSYICDSEVKVNIDLKLIVNSQLIQLLKEFKNIFAWTYKDLKVIPPKIVQH